MVAGSVASITRVIATGPLGDVALDVNIKKIDSWETEASFERVRLNLSNSSTQAHDTHTHLASLDALTCALSERGQRKY